jgi:hypothetical protein
MVLFSTVLFVNGNPVGYKVMEEERNRLSLNPAENPNREIFAPVIQAKKEDGYWRIEGTHDRDLIDQVLEDISMQLPSSLQSAAP